MVKFGLKTTAEEAAGILKEDITGKTVLVTGVSPNSLGEETVRVISSYAKTIIIASRSKERVDEALIVVRKAAPNADIQFVQLDLLSQESIRRAAKAILALDIPIHVVINNAAVAHVKTLTFSSEGHEAHFAANVLGQFLLTSLIFPAILRGASERGSARVVNVSSLALAWGGEIRWDDQTYKKRPEEYNMNSAYAQSKMGITLFTRELARRFKEERVLAFSLSPGLVLGTNMGSKIPMKDLQTAGLFDDEEKPKEGIYPKSIGEGTSTQVIAAFDPSLETKSGAFLDDGEIHEDRIPDYAHSDENAKKLWELCEELLNHKFA